LIFFNQYVNGVWIFDSKTPNPKNAGKSKLVKFFKIFKKIFFSVTNILMEKMDLLPFSSKPKIFKKVNNFYQKVFWILKNGQK